MRFLLKNCLSNTIPTKKNSTLVLEIENSTLKLRILSADFFEEFIQKVAT